MSPRKPARRAITIATTIVDASQLQPVLVALREASGLSQDEVAKRLGVSRPRVSQIERAPDRCAVGILLAYLRAVGATMSLQQRVLPERPLSIDAPEAW